MNYVKRKVPIEELLAGLAEEAAELAQAALKLRRVFNGVNPTPVSEEQAMERLYEEIADVKLYVSLLDMNPQFISDLMNHKLSRWRDRLEERDKENEQKTGEKTNPGG